MVVDIPDPYVGISVHLAMAQASVEHTFEALIPFHSRAEVGINQLKPFDEKLLISPVQFADETAIVRIAESKPEWPTLLSLGKVARAMNCRFRKHALRSHSRTIVRC